MKQARLLFITGCAALLACGSNNAWTQGSAKGAAPAFPERPVRMLVPFAPGGNTDILARAVGQRMSDNWGKPVGGSHALDAGRTGALYQIRNGKVPQDHPGIGHQA